MPSALRVLFCLCWIAGCSADERSARAVPISTTQGDVGQTALPALRSEPRNGGGDWLGQQPHVFCDDTDRDGYGPGCAAGSDCEPDEPFAHPGASEVCFDHLDNDCDGTVDEDCDCDPSVDACAEEVPLPPQTLGEFVFDLSRGFMEMDAVCGAERVQALDARREPIVGAIDELVSTGDAVLMAEVARDVLEPLITSGGLETTANAAAEALSLLVDDSYDPERRTLAALVSLLRSERLPDRRHVLSLLSGALADARLPQLLHEIAVLGRKNVGPGGASRELLATLSSTLQSTSATAECRGLALDGAVDKLLDPSRMPPRSDLGAPAWLADAHTPNRRIDVKRTGLGFLLELASDAVAKGVPHDVTLLVEAALGPQAACGQGCMRYRSSPHPLADLAYIATDLLRYDETRALLDALVVLLRDRPQVAASLAIATGTLIERVRASQIEPSQWIGLVRELLPLVARVFAQDAQTPRLLLQAVHDLGKVSRDFPQQLKWTLDYARLVKSPACSDRPPDLARSVPVNYAAPRGQNNRSALEQVVEGLAAVDCGRVPFSGEKTLGLFVLDTVADMRPGTVCGLTDRFLRALGRAPRLGKFFTRIGLRTIGCKGARDVVDRLYSLEDLAASGALDFLIPLNKVFQERGQLHTLIAMSRVVAEDLQRDDDADPTTHSAVRPLLPVLSDLIEEGAADALFDLLDVLVTVETPDADGKMAKLSDVLIDAAAFVLQERNVPTRARDVAKTSYARELLAPLELVLQRVDTHPGRAAARRLFDHVETYLEGDQGRLANRAVLPMARVLFESLAEVWSLPRGARDCYVDGLMTDTERMLTSRELATLVRLAALVRNAPSRPLLDAVGSDWLSGRGKQGQGVLVPLLQVSAALLERPPPSKAVEQLLPYVATVLDPDVTHGPTVLDSVDVLLQADDEQVFLGMLRKALKRGPRATQDAPVSVLMDAYAPVLAIAPDACTPEHRPWSPRGLDSAVRTLLGFMRDPDAGLPVLFDALEQMVAQAP